MFGLKYAGPVGHFAQVRVNDELALDWDNREGSTVTTTRSW